MGISTALVWVTAAVVLVLLVTSSVIFVNTYQHRSDRNVFTSVVCIVALTSLFATVCLLPIDVALVSATTDNTAGLKKSWATPEVVGHTLLQLKVLYYFLYSLDAIMCLLVLPFAYFLYEEQDDDNTLGQSIKGALKYCVGLLALIVALFLTGFFVPVARDMHGHVDFDYFRLLLVESNGEKALTFITGVLISLGTILYIIYAAPGFALLPVSMIKTVPIVSSAATSSRIHQELLEVQEELRIIESRASGSTGYRLTDKDRRSLEGLQRRERTLRRKLRLEDEARQSSWLFRIKATLRSFTILFGLILLFIAIGIWVSMLLTAIDKIKHSLCGRSCGYILPHPEIFNPVNAIFVSASTLFPLDYTLTLFLVLDLFMSTIVGISFIGIRFLWITFFRVRKGRTRPQGLLLSTAVLTLAMLAINYTLPMIIAPQYGHFGNQMYCSRNLSGTGLADCTKHPEFLRPCTEEASTDICTPTVASSFMNRVTLNFPFFGVFMLWSQFVFLGVFILTALTSLVRTPTAAGMDAEGDLAEEEEEEEEEGLLEESRRRFGATWNDLNHGHGTGDSGSEAAGGVSRTRVAQQTQNV